MDYRTYSVWTPASRAGVPPNSLQPGAGDRLPPVQVPSLFATGVANLFDTVWGWFRRAARLLIGGLEVLQRLLEHVGWLPARRDSVVATTAVVAQSPHSFPLWAAKSAAEWSGFGGVSTPNVTTVPEDLPSPSVVRSSLLEVPATGSSGGAEVPTKEDHAKMSRVEEPTANPERDRAWFLATNPLMDTANSVDEVAWDEIPMDEVRGILSTAVAARCQPYVAARSDGERCVLGNWLGPVARTAYANPVERLQWMATLTPILVRCGIGDDRRAELRVAIVDWLQEIDRRDPRTVLNALRIVEMVSASGIDPKGALVEMAGGVWSARAWPRMRVGDAGDLLRVCVTQMTSALARSDGPRARMFAQVIIALAPACHVDVADRLSWFARDVARPVGLKGLDGSPVRDVLTQGVGRWFAELSKQPTGDAIQVVLEWWRVPLGACTDEAQMEGWLAEVRPGPVLAPNIVECSA